MKAKEIEKEIGQLFDMLARINKLWTSVVNELEVFYPREALKLSKPRRPYRRTGKYKRSRVTTARMQVTTVPSAGAAHNFLN